MEALTIENIGNVVLFIAPGYFARLVYRSIFPSRPLGDIHTLITSIAYSVPIVFGASRPL